MAACFCTTKRSALAGATAYLKLLGDVVGGWMLAKGALAVSGMAGGDAEWKAVKVALARVYAQNVLAGVPGQAAAVKGSTADNSPAHTATSPGVSFQKPPTNQGTITKGSATVKIGGKPAGSVITDRKWLETDFITGVQNRGAAIIKARGLSSAMSAAARACSRAIA